MEPSFWHQRWNNDEIAFHERGGNALFISYFDRLSLAPGSRVFVPLCGKTRDIAWLLARGFRVAGAELSEIAVRQLFEELGVKPDISDAGRMKRYRAPDIEIFLGDIFDLSAPLLGPVDAIYDRAALVALPEDMRARYAAHLQAITNKARQLLICFEYDQNAQEGPPFSVDEAEVARLYAKDYSLSLLHRAEIPGGLKKICPAQEVIRLLMPR